MVAPPIFLFDTGERRKKQFTPLVSGNVGVYTCGPTVYDYPHIGNLRAYVFADTLRRMFEYNGLTVRHVMNITDVGHLTSDADEGEDKMELSARKTGKSAWDIAEFFTEIFRRNLVTLNIREPHVFPKATEHIPDQIALVRRLEERGYTYRTSDGIYFDTSKFPAYGKMARIKQDGMKPGARVALNPEKRNPTDFALWKFSPSGAKRQMEWDNPWGVGFPGWHVECSAMAMRYLGETFDIHTGGIDHIPIHHTNEIAQSEAATGKPFVRYWLHCAFIRVEGKKMSKSLGNTYTIDDIVKKGYDPLAFRYLLLTGHYRSGMNFTWEALNAAEKALAALRTHVGEWPDGSKAPDKLVGEFQKLISDDLDTPGVLAYIWEQIIHPKSKEFTDAEKKAALLDFDQVLGLNLATLQSKSVSLDELPPEVRVMIAEREQLRSEKRWMEADEIRRKIVALGYTVEDTPSGTRRGRNHR
ncbi:MAG: cysteine--tRNA ligase [bacterium]|nr:cysteine--tRNA ligase [bacterium]